MKRIQPAARPWETEQLFGFGCAIIALLLGVGIIGFLYLLLK
jgi:hypothetical protein